MGMFDFRRCDGFTGSIPQKFIDSNLPKCPMCGSTDPYWMLKDKMTFTEKRMLFRCDKCGCILSASQADFTGFSKSKVGLLTTAGAMNFTEGIMTTLGINLAEKMLIPFISKLRKLGLHRQQNCMREKKCR